MTASDDREGLLMRQVELKHLDQFNDLLRYVFQVTDSDLEEGGYEDDSEIMQAKRPVLHAADVFGWFDKDKLISQLAIYPCQVNIHETIYQMGGITGVGTYPEYANLGLMHELIIFALEHMRKNEQWISYLFPYNIPYYRRKGWEIISDKMTFKIKDTQLPKPIKLNGSVERLEIDDPEVLEVYRKFSMQNHGAMFRDRLNWSEYWRWDNEEEYTAAVYYNQEGQPMGFCLYTIAEEVFKIKELIYLNQEARKGLWNFISAHFSMIEWVEGNNYKNEPIAFLFDDSEIKETIEPYYMARIVDVAEFLKNYPFSSTGKPFHFIVHDPLAQWNHRIFGLIWDENDEVAIVNEPLGHAVELDIQTLTVLMMSYKRPSYLYRIERLKTDRETLRTLERIIPDQEPYFSDYF